MGQTMFDRAAAFAIAAILAATVSAARAQPVDFNHVVSVAGSQATASQMMAKEALLIALEVERGPQVQSLDNRLDLFDRTLAGLRDGDELLGLPAAVTPEIADRLDVAASHWRIFSPVFREGIETGSISAEQIGTIALNSAGLTAALEAVTLGYAEESNKNRLTSMLANARLEAIRGTMLSQRMATQFLLIAYGHDADSSRFSLGGSVTRFEEALGNLANGNLERRMLPPPNDAIRDEITRTRRIWEDELRPVIRMALDIGDLPPESVARMAVANDRLLEHLKTLTSFYAGL